MSSLGSRWTWPVAMSLIVLVGGFISGWQVLQRIGIGLFCLLAICIVVTVVSALTLSAEGKPRSRTATAGDTLTITYTIRNRGLWPVVWALFRPQGFSTLPVEGQLVAVPWRGDRRLDVMLPCPQRGRWVAGGAVLHTGDPFGFFERSRTRAGTEIITVYPRSIPLPGLQLPPLLGRGISPRGRPSPQPSATVREVRPYRSGDLPSRVHWLSTARLDALMVKEPEGEPAAHVWLVLDLDARIQYGEDEGDSAELVIGAAGHVVREQLPVWIAAGLLVAGTDTIVKPDARRGHAARLLDELAVVMPGEGDVERDVHTLLTSSGTRRSTIIVITPWADDRWSRNLRVLAHTGSTVLCVLLDTPDSGLRHALDAQAASLRGHGVQVYRHTAWAA
ncbi:MAG: hypothetical protein JWO59_2420 [Chloroflexi bacterium]|nr:hypothetical protein [Chloroflexota bacterium]